MKMLLTALLSISANAALAENDSLSASRHKSWLHKSNQIIGKVSEVILKEDHLKTFFVTSIQLQLNFSDQGIEVVPVAELVDTTSGNSVKTCQLTFTVIPNFDGSEVSQVKLLANSCLEQ